MWASSSLCYLQPLEGEPGAQHKCTTMWSPAHICTSVPLSPTLAPVFTTGIHLEGAAAARDETAAACSSIVLSVGRKLRNWISSRAASNPGESPLIMSVSQAVYTHRDFPDSVHTLTLLFTEWFVWFWYAEVSTGIFRIFCTVNTEPWGRQRPADYWQPCVLDPCSTFSRNFLLLIKKKPKSPLNSPPHRIWM